VRVTAAVLAVPTVILCFAATYYAVSFGRLIDARLHGERDTTLPRVFARPLELRRGQSLTDRQLIDRLNDLGYAHRDRVEKPGEFAVGQGAVAILQESDRAGGVRTPTGRRAGAAAKSTAAEGTAAARRRSRSTARARIEAE
jgi:hypothetical protein